MQFRFTFRIWPAMTNPQIKQNLKTCIRDKILSNGVSANMNKRTNAVLQGLFTNNRKIFPEKGCMLKYQNFVMSRRENKVERTRHYFSIVSRGANYIINYDN